MDFEEALEILGVTKSSNFDSFRLDISRNWKKLLIKYQGKNDKELSRVNRAYDLLKRISNDEFDKIFDDEIIENDIFIEDTNEDLFSEENNSSNVTYGIDTDVIEDNNEDLFSEENNFNSETYKEDLKKDINSEIQFDLSKTYTFKPTGSCKFFLKLLFTFCLIGAVTFSPIFYGDFFYDFSPFLIFLLTLYLLRETLRNSYIKFSPKGIYYKYIFFKKFISYDLIKGIILRDRLMTIFLNHKKKFEEPTEYLLAPFGNVEILTNLITFLQEKGRLKMPGFEPVKR